MKNQILFGPIEMLKICKIKRRISSDWNRKGILPHQKKGKKLSWNKFNIEDIFLINIAIELRKYNITIEKIKKIQKWIKEKNNIQEIIEKGSKQWMYLLTDLEKNNKIIEDKDLDFNTRGLPGLIIIINLVHVINKTTQKI